MRYLNKRTNGSYRYLRRYPTGFAATYPNLPKQYSREFPEINDASTEEQKHTALAKAAKHYDLHIKTLKASDPNAYSETERAMAVEEVLRQKQMSRGSLHHASESGWVDNMFPELWGMPSDTDRAKTDQPYTFKESVLIDAYFAAQVLPEVKLEMTLRQAWGAYLKRELIHDTNNGTGKDKQQRFERVISITGDFTIADETKRDVLGRLQHYIIVKQSEGMKAQTIKRSLKEVFAAVRGVPQLAWSDAVTLNPKKNSLVIAKEAKEVKGRVLLNEELDKLIDKAINEPDKYYICLLLQLHAGLGPMEIKRLRLEKDVYLDAPVPHILFRGGDDGITKKDARVRVVPIVLGLPQIKQWLPKVHQWLNSIVDKSPPATLNKKLRALIEDAPDVKTHSLRHTWLRLANRANVGARHEHAIGGWSKKNDGEINRLTETVYDPNGFRDDPELLVQLCEAQKAVFRRWLSYEKAEADNNVVVFNGDKSR